MGIQPSPQGRKGAWTPSHVLALSVITLVVMAILLLLYGQLGNITKRTGDKEACSQSVRLNAYTKLRTVTGADFGKYIVDQYGNRVDLQCSTEYLKVRTDDPERMKETVAKSMMDCWQMYGEGELEVFETRDNTYCAVCSRLEFEKEALLPGFTRYLMDTPAPQQDITYLEYFKGGAQRCGGKILPERDTPDILEGSDLTKIDSIDTGSPLAVLFVLGKNAYPNGFVEAGEIDTLAWGVGIGSFIGLVTGIVLCATGVGCVAGAPLLVMVGAIATTVAGSGIAGGVIGGGLGYGIGSSCTSGYDAYVMLWNYSDLRSLGCTYLESEAAPLEVRYV